MINIKENTRRILAIMSLVFLFVFYMLRVFGYDVPAEVNIFWTPPGYYFIARGVEKVKKQT